MYGAIAVLATFATSVIGDHLVLGAIARRLAMMMLLVPMLLVVLGLMILITAICAMPRAMSNHNSKPIQSKPIRLFSKSCLMDADRWRCVAAFC